MERGEPADVANEVFRLANQIPGYLVVAYVAAVSPPTGGASQPDNGQDLISSLAIRARQREIESLRQPFAQGERQIQKVADKLAADPRTGGHEV